MADHEPNSVRKKLDVTFGNKPRSGKKEDLKEFVDMLDEVELWAILLWVPMSPH